MMTTTTSSLVVMVLFTIQNVSDVTWGQRWTTGENDVEYKYGVLLPKGTIKHFIGIDMEYNDEPIQINNY